MEVMPNSNAHIDVVPENPKDHPKCSHGPTILFSKSVKGVRRKFFACAACRDRKHCNFFLWEEDVGKFKKDVWDQECVHFVGNTNHRKKFSALSRVRQSPAEKRKYCLQCSQLFTEELNNKHGGHKFLQNVTDYQLDHPSELLSPLEDGKKEAQYLFAKSSAEFIVGCILKLGYKNVLCIGTPRIHEYFKSNCKGVNSLLLDFDRRYHDFFGPLEYCWYNMFNHHFFLEGAKNVFDDFVSCDGATILVTDPPFGGRVEPIAFTLETINKQYKKAHGTKNDLPIFWIFPYFMEPQILNSVPNFHMLDYKVNYENHPLFQDGHKARKLGSPVRIFTNISPSLIALPPEDYKHCQECNRWVALENRHCNSCDSCTSKNGVTYVHCYVCNRCVKPTWKHCDNCKRCALVGHKCGVLIFMKECYNCKQPGHKKSDCPQISRGNGLKRKKVTKTTVIKKKK